MSKYCRYLIVPVVNFEGCSSNLQDQAVEKGESVIFHHLKVK